MYLEAPLKQTGVIISAHIFEDLLLKIDENANQQSWKSLLVPDHNRNGPYWKLKS